MDQLRKEFFQTSINRLRDALQHNFEYLQQTAHFEELSFCNYSLPDSQPLLSFNIHDIDSLAQAMYPADGPTNVHPVKVAGDRNCLFRSFSLAMFGTEGYHIEMRARAIIELLCHSEHYLSVQNMFHSNDQLLLFWMANYSSPRETSYLNMHYIDNVSRVLKAVIADSLNSNSWVGIWHIAALSSVLHRPVKSIYPAEAVGIATNSTVRYVLNRSLYSRTEINTTECIKIMWTSCSPKCTQLWQPNHFVVCFSDESFQSQNSKQFFEGASEFSDKKLFSQVESKFSENTKFLKPESKKFNNCQPESNFSKSQFQNQNAKSQFTDKGTPKKREMSKQANSTKAKYLKTNTGIKEVKDFRHDIQNLKSFIEQIPKSNCHHCKRILFPNDEKVYSQQCRNYIVCGKCLSSLNRGTSVPLAYANNLDPGIIPPELKGLNVMEKRLISKIHLYLTIVILPGGQFGEKGQSIHFPIEISEMCKNLPKPVENSDIISVKPNNSSDVSYPVSYRKVYNALHWLKKNNILYKDINIINSTSSEIKPCSGTDPWPDVIECSITQSHALPNVSKKCLFDNSVSKQNAKTDSTFTFPANTSSAVKLLGEITTPLEELAFPWLFPWGKNGFSAKRKTKITDLAYFQSRLMNSDTRFSNEIPYLFFANSVYEARKLSDCISIALRMKSSSTNSIQKLKAGDLRGTVKADIIEDSYVFMRQIRGTPAYWRNELMNLLARIRTLGAPTWFITLSAADLQWPDLFNLLTQGKKRITHT